jgi:SnoaL-like domain
VAGLVSEANLEARLRALEDRLSIYELLASYGPAVDTRDKTRVDGLWSPDGSYSFDDVTLTQPRVGELVDLDSHTAFITAGCGHVLSMPAIEVDGDVAVAINYSVVFEHRRGQNEWAAARVSANRWELARAATGWQVTNRVNRLLDGSEKARDLLARP